MYRYAEPDLTLPSTKYRMPEMRLSEGATFAGTLSYALVLVFLFLFYLQPALLLPSLNAFRPVYVVGGLAIGLLIVDRLLRHKGFEFSRPHSFLLIGFLITAGISCF